MSSLAVSVSTLQSTPTRATSRTPQVSTSAERAAIPERRRLPQSVLQPRSHPLPLRAARRYSAPSFPTSSPTPPRIIESHEESNARMGQIEAYLAEDPNQSPVPPISAAPSLTRYQYLALLSTAMTSPRTAIWIDFKPLWNEWEPYRGGRGDELPHIICWTRTIA
ncbi:hypothetical protein ARMSODRAFT_665922 [Armillaria solidipes]|uniref:Uncharacterized protein n=1 Tax=Armillaria solidipes TaxID=1076256 RepID=A0A2H3BA39_9AGAR|nr:hypothetical protein ARMSODRAFT_665922 [Armillaria solidipes]